MATPAQKSVDELVAFQAASLRWRVPLEILWGVYGMETDFGANMKTSSAGAVGAMQFLPSTADDLCRQWHGRGCYPKTNTPTKAQKAQQVMAAAHYLNMLYGSAGGGDTKARWDSALNSYSGGGYGLQEVLDKAKGKQTIDPKGSGVPGLDETKNAVSDAVDAASAPMQAIAGFIGALFQASTWFRIGKVVLGAILLVLLGYQLLR